MDFRSIALAALTVIASGHAFACDPPLTPSRVADYIETRIETNRLQRQIAENAAAHDDAVQAFFVQRNALLERRGWGVEAFERTQQRVLAAATALDQRDDWRAERADHEEEKAGIRANEHLSPEQKRQMLEAIEKLRAARQAQFRRTREDWPAVEAYRDELRQLTDWIAGNTSEPPQLQR